MVGVKEGEGVGVANNLSTDIVWHASINIIKPIAKIKTEAVLFFIQVLPILDFCPLYVASQKSGDSRPGCRHLYPQNRHRRPYGLRCRQYAYPREMAIMRSRIHQNL